MQPKHSPATTSTQTPSAKNPVSTNTDDRRRMVAEAAYFRAQHRAFQGGDCNDDWYRAESDIDAMLKKTQAH